MRGADALAATLARAGVERIFSLSGNQIMPIYDACIDAGISLVHVRHEAAAVHMADAWGRLTARPGVALMTAGPGHANAISALYSARMSESPVLALSGHAPLARGGQGAFQEMAQAAMAAPVCKASWTAGDAADLGRLTAKALAVASGPRPGPVHLSVPFDVVQADVGRVARGRKPRPAAPPHDKDVARLARWLSRGSRPLILAGSAFANASHRTLIQALDGSGNIPALALESPRGINDPALGAFAEVLARADRILFLGRGPDYCVRFAQEPFVDAKCRFAQVDPDHAMVKRARRVLGKRLRRTLEADPGAVAAMLTAALARRSDGAPWAEEVRTAINHRPEAWSALAGDPARGVHPVRLCAAVQRLIDSRRDVVLVTDGGEFGQWSQACLRAPRRITNGPSGAIGASLPFACAARLAAPGSTVVAMLGDGTVGFHLAEFDTALRAGAPFVAVVGNDARWNAEHQIQLRDYGPERLIGCELMPTRYDRVVQALGGYGEYVEHEEELGAALERAATSGLPSCVNVKLDGQAAPVIRR